ncbi:MAG TPA: amidohydrolase family protein [Phycisphaerae bacterium]|nr:amidohydrolase family protein [Phycisphaerae bacterium]
MNVKRIVHARRRDLEGLWTLELDAGRIAAIVAEPAPATPGRRAAADEVDAAGGLVTPALVDAHVHLDLAYSLDLVPENQSGTLLEAIGLWSRAKAEITAENTRARAVRAIRTEVGFGTGILRSHIDVGSGAGLRLCEGVLAAREDTCRECKIQLVAFPQDGLIRDPGAVDLMRQALKSGVDLVGGIPHIERVPRDGLRHLELVFDLAAEFNTAIDVHIDETDDPQSMYTEHLAALTIERGWQGRVTASHVCALSSYTDVHAARVIGLLAEAGVRVVTNPGVNLHLQGRCDRYPKRRGLTRVRELLDAGVICAAGQDCIKDPFYPLGTGQMLDQAWLLVHADHMSSPHRMKQAMEMICCQAGEVVNLGCHRVLEGATANLAVWPVAEIPELLRLRPRPRAVLHDGRLIGRARDADDAPTVSC